LPFSVVGRGGEKKRKKKRGRGNFMNYLPSCFFQRRETIAEEKKGNSSTKQRPLQPGWKGRKKGEREGEKITSPYN